VTSVPQVSKEIPIVKLKMAPNSLFAVLLRSPWWISIAIAAAMAGASRLALPPDYVVFGAMGGIPFVVIGVVAAWRQFRAPSEKSVIATIEAVQAMSWKEFSAALEAAFVRDGCTVEALKGPAADFAVAKGSRVSLVSAKRWKAASLGVEPLRELDAAVQAREAQESIYITLGAMSDNARRFASEHKIRVITGTELAVLLGKQPAARKA